MHLKALQLVNFKNYDEIRLEFSENVNVLVGSNGSGKTNLLDSIYYLSLTRSAFLAVDTQLIRTGEKYFSVKGQFVSGNSVNDVLCAVQIGSKKVVKDGVNEYQKLTDHIGRFPVVLVAPDDTELVREGSEERRKFFDTIISQIDRTYLESLIRYNHVLKQRNSLLKMFGESKTFDPLALDSYNRVMIPTGDKIYRRRAEFIKEFSPVFHRYYTLIVDNAETVDLNYSSDLDEISFAEGLKKNQEKDLALQRSNFGVHRDDYPFQLGGYELKRMGSQGQQKSFVIALKLAQFEILETRLKTRPILLLDDIFDKLDDLRISKLLELIRNGAFGQIFITDARPDRTAGLLDEIGVGASIFTVENGTIIEE